MKAPDKIVLPAAAREMRFLIDDTVYIRKDALLEWAKETYLNENASAIRKVCYKQVIDKLNSM